MTRKILSLLIVIAMTLTVLPVMAFADEAESGGSSGGESGGGTSTDSGGGSASTESNGSFDSDAHVDNLVKAADAAANAAKDAEKALNAIADDANNAKGAKDAAEKANDDISGNFGADGTPTGSAGDKVDNAEDALGDANTAIGNATDVQSAVDAIEAVNDAADAVNDMIGDVDTAIDNAGKAAAAAADAIEAANDAIGHASDAINKASEAMMAAQDADDAYSALLQDAVDNDDSGAYTALAEAENELNQAWGTYVGAIQNAAELVRDAADKAAEAQQSAADARKAYEDAYNAIMRDTISASEQKWQDLEAMRENARRSAMDAYDTALKALEEAMKVKALAEDAKGFANSANLRANKAVDWLEDWLENDVKIEALKANLQEAIDTVNALEPGTPGGGITIGKPVDFPDFNKSPYHTGAYKVNNNDSPKTVLEGVTVSLNGKIVTIVADSNLITGTFDLYISDGSTQEYQKYTITITGKYTIKMELLGNNGHVYLGGNDLTKVSYPEVKKLNPSPGPRGNNEWKAIYGPSGFEIIGDPVEIIIPDPENPEPVNPEPVNPVTPGGGDGGGGGSTAIVGFPVPLTATVTIEDEEVPLGELPDTVTIIDEDVPLGNLPVTGGSGVPASAGMVTPHAMLNDDKRKLIPDVEDFGECDD